MTDIVLTPRNYGNPLFIDNYQAAVELRSKRFDMQQQMQESNLSSGEYSYISDDKHNIVSYGPTEPLSLREAYNLNMMQDEDPAFTPSLPGQKPK